VRRAVNEEWERLRRSDKTRADLAQSRRRIAAAARAAAPAAAATQAEPGLARPAAAGDRVEVAHLGLTGQVLAVDGGTATVQAGAIAVKVPVQGLRVLGPGAPSAAPSRGPGQAGRVSTPGKTGIGPEIHLIGRTTDEARALLEKYLDDAFLAGLATVRIVHGKGTGALRRTVEDLLAAHPLVSEHRPGAPEEGGAGATVAVLGEA
jgi:DNA mismatch repair protein MutS2